jgi:hypothetical protein
MESGSASLSVLLLEYLVDDISWIICISSGGGKGIRKVKSEEEFPLAFQQVQSEIPGSPIFIMKLASK